MTDYGDIFWKNWAEISALIILLVGFFMAVSMNNPAYIYIVIFIAGLFAGRYHFSQISKRPLFPIFLIIIGFLLGYILGSFAADRRIVVLIFIIGWAISYIVHKKGIIKV